MPKLTRVIFWLEPELYQRVHKMAASQAQSVARVIEECIKVGLFDLEESDRREEITLDGGVPTAEAANDQ